MPIHLGGMKLLSLEEVRQTFPATDRPSRETLRRYIRTGRIAGRKIGSSWWISERMLVQYFEGKPMVDPEAPPMVPQ